MRLLFDQNLSHKLVDMLVDLYPGSRHVRDVGLATADDDVVWTYAAIVSKDADYDDLVAFESDAVAAFLALA